MSAKIGQRRPAAAPWGNKGRRERAPDDGGDRERLCRGAFGIHLTWEKCPWKDWIIFLTSDIWSRRKMLPALPPFPAPLKSRFSYVHPTLAYANTLQT